MQRHDDELAAHEAALSERLAPGVMLDATFRDGELTFLADGVPVISGIFEDAAAGAFIHAQWKVLAATFPVTASTTGKKLCTALRKLAANDASAAVRQIMECQVELAALDTAIAQREAGMNAAVHALYGLTQDEIRMVGRGMGERG